MSDPHHCLPARCLGAMEIAGLAYSLAKHKLHLYFNIKYAKILSVLAVLLLVGHSWFYRDTCQRLQFTGSFVGKNEWSPDGCTMHKYTSTEAKTCLAGKRIVFIGDSRIRGLFNLFIYIIVPQAKPYMHTKHEDATFKMESITLELLWNPVTNILMKERLVSVSQDPVKPDVVIVGAATWGIKQNNGSSEGLEYYSNNISSMAGAMDRLSHYGDVYWYLQDPMKWKALSADRKMITDEQIDLYNNAAARILNATSSRIKLYGASRQVAKATIDESYDGLHMSWTTQYMGAMLFMNAVCNRVLRPMGACCQTSPPLTPLQTAAYYFFIGSTLLFLILHVLRKTSQQQPKTPDVESSEENKLASTAPPLVAEEVCKALCKMGLIMAYVYMCDRSDVFIRESKPQPESYSIVIPLSVLLILGLLFTENTKQSHVLNREQTDEWKGWMQLVILVYHMTGASAFIPVYMHVRVLVAAYLFQTGYGHFSFFWLKADFGLYRLSQVLFRLNFLVVTLCVVMDRPYQFYYFVPLVTFWFVVIYGTLAIWPKIVQKKANNSDMSHLGIILKLLGLLLLICLFAHSQGWFESTFSVWPVSEIFKLNGNVHEWWFRWRLDCFAVVGGMLFAFLYLLLQKRQLLHESRGDSLFSNQISISLLLLSLLALMLYSVWASNCTSKPKCNEMHPYISVVPILAFILVRNIPGFLRSRYSSFFAWFGRISLELFICQYHIWLAADTKGVLVLVPGHPFLNLLISSFIFVCVAHEISQITSVLSQLILPTDTRALLKRLGAMGLLSLVLLLLLDKGHSWA